MVKKTAVILGILAMLALAAGMSWGYTVSKWPIGGIPNITFEPGAAALVSPECFVLRGPVAPSCEPPLVPGVIHSALSAPMTAIAMAANPLFTGQMLPPLAGACEVQLGDPAYVIAAVPCTAVNRYIPPCGF
jgi:hypothetical protein